MYSKITRIALYFTVGIIGWAVNPEGSYLLTIAPFTLIAMILEISSYKEGVVNGMYIYKNLSSEDKKKIDTILKEMDNA